VNDSTERQLQAGAGTTAGSSGAGRAVPLWKVPRWLVPLALLLLAACAPRTELSSVTPRTYIGVPELTLLEGETSVERFDPPGAGSLLTLQIAALLHNPNTFPITVTEIEYGVSLEKRTSTHGLLEVDTYLDPGETLPLQFTVETPLGRNPDLLRAAVRAFAGRPLAFRVDGHIRFVNESHRFRSSSRLLLEGSVLARESVRAPQLGLLAGASEVFALQPAEPVIRLVLTAVNPGDIGYFLHGKDLSLSLDGQLITTGDLRPTPVPARDSSRIDILFYPDLARLGPEASAALTEALMGKDVAVELDGRLFMDVLGLDSFAVPDGWAVQGVLGARQGR
jgi:hypothetical protein